MPHAEVRPAQRHRAKQLRKDMTGPEKKLWHELKAHRAGGAHFRRQVPIGAYIADFACHNAKLIIEIDGDQHSIGRQQTSDARRDTWFAEQGYQTLRFSNWQVMNEFESVVLTIAAAAQGLLKDVPVGANLPSPPLWGRAGEGGMPPSIEVQLGSTEPAPAIPPSQPSPTRGEGSRASSGQEVNDGKEQKP
ncbi:endonuclease domain-containing protein [Bosea sp. LjRoot237]|uniref:endonuclease domain-containing protein n=1 Tax=Bosea sp. LjRoot237 TaxID=3342292 RepID=UPI003ECC234A